MEEASRDRMVDILYNYVGSVAVNDGTTESPELVSMA
jgi:hypothetical protein